MTPVTAGDPTERTFVCLFPLFAGIPTLLKSNQIDGELEAIEVANAQLFEFIGVNEAPGEIIKTEGGAMLFVITLVI